MKGEPYARAIAHCAACLHAELLKRLSEDPQTSAVPHDLEPIFLASIYRRDARPELMALARALHLAAEANLVLNDENHKRRVALAKASRELAQQVRVWTELAAPFAAFSQRWRGYAAADPSVAGYSLPSVYEQLSSSAALFDGLAAHLEEQMLQMHSAKPPKPEKSSKSGRPSEETLCRIVQVLRDDGKFTFREIARMSEGRADKHSIDRARKRYKIASKNWPKK